jgi:TonB family protein
MRPGIATVLLLAAAVTPAAADPVTLSQGPAADRDAIVASLATARSLMGVCWQNKPPASVKIAVSVAATGEVTNAAAKTKGAAAQCAAGILAVSTLAPTKKAWKGVVELATAADDRGRDAARVGEQLAAAGDRFRRCQDEAPKFAGSVALTITVGEDGAIRDASGEIKDTKAGKGAAVARCVAAVARKLVLEPLGGAQLTYQLTIGFAGGDATATGTRTAADPALKPSKKGPLDADALTSVLRTARTSVAACAKKTRATGKLVVRVAIAPDGKVTSAKIKESELDDAAAEACVVKALDKLRFGASTGETVVHYPIRFEADGIVTGD